MGPPAHLDVSVVIPTFNRADLLPAAVLSALGQTRPPLEVVVVDDGSTDDTQAVIDRLLLVHGDVLRYVWQPNGGEPVARNRGIAAARAPLVAFLDSDDTWRREKLEQQVPTLEADARIGASFTAYSRHQEGAEQLVRVEAWDPDPVGVLRSLLVGSCMTPSTVILRRDVVIAAGGFDETWRVSCDWEMWTRLALRGVRVGYVDEPLTDYHVHPDGLSRDDLLIARLGLKVLDRVFADPNLPEAVRRSRLKAYARWHLINAERELEAGDAGAARRHLLRAARMSPLVVRPGWFRLLARSLRPRGTALAAPG